MAEIKTENQVRREFENYVLEVNGNEDMLNKWPSGSYRNPAVHGQYIGWRECEKRTAVLSANAGKVDAEATLKVIVAELINGYRCEDSEGRQVFRMPADFTTRIAKLNRPTQQAIDAGKV